MGDGLFGDMFDFDNNGELNSFEQAAEIGFVTESIDDTDEEEESWRENYDYDADTMIDPDDYESEEEYIDAINEAKITYNQNENNSEFTNTNYYEAECLEEDKATNANLASNHDVDRLREKILSVQRQIKENTAQLEELMKLRKDLIR